MSKESSDAMIKKHPILFGFLMGFFLTGIVWLSLGGPCNRYSNKWVEEYSYQNNGQKHRPWVTVPAHWESYCEER